MTAERLAVWTVALACLTAAWVAAFGVGVAVPADRGLAVTLGALAALPLAVVALARLSSRLSRQRGWR
jgi:streptomycin 6-kinase